MLSIVCDAKGPPASAYSTAKAAFLELYQGSDLFRSAIEKLWKESTDRREGAGAVWHVARGEEATQVRVKP